MDRGCQGEFAWTDRSEEGRRKYLARSQLTDCEIELLVALGSSGRKVKHDGNWLVAEVAKRELAGRGFSPEAMRKAAVRLSESESELVRVEPGKGGKKSTYWVDLKRLAGVSDLPRSALKPRSKKELGNLGNLLAREKKRSKQRRDSVYRVPCSTRGSAETEVAATGRGPVLPVAKTGRGPVLPVAADDPLADILRSRTPWRDLRDWHVRTCDLRLAQHLYRHAIATDVLGDVATAKLFLAQFHHAAHLRKPCEGQRADGTGGRNNAAAILSHLVRKARRDVIQDASWDWAAAQIRRKSESTRRQSGVLRSPPAAEKNDAVELVRQLAEATE